jgi:hypothetical protein
MIGPPLRESREHRTLQDVETPRAAIGAKSSISNQSVATNREDEKQEEQEEVEYIEEDDVVVVPWGEVTNTGSLKGGGQVEDEGVYSEDEDVSGMCLATTRTSMLNSQRSTRLPSPVR